MHKRKKHSRHRQSGQFYMLAYAPGQEALHHTGTLEHKRHSLNTSRYLSLPEIRPKIHEVLFGPVEAQALNLLHLRQHPQKPN
jgi:hypothetical protein